MSKYKVRKGLTKKQVEKEAKRLSRALLELYIQYGIETFISEMPNPGTTQAVVLGITKLEQSELDEMPIKSEAIH